MSGRLGQLIACTLLAAAALTGCGGEVRRDDDAAALVTDYLGRIAGSDPDRGWSLLLPTTQRTTFGGDRDSYIQAAEATDWTDFRWEITSVERDEPYLYHVVVTADAVLPNIIHSVTYFDEGESGLEGRRGTFSVRLQPLFGDNGIHHRGERAPDDS
jgi:hypothetical protein